MFLNLYRDIRYSLNPRFELELAMSKLSKLRYVASTASIIEQLARLKNDLINGTISPLNPILADQKTVQPEAPSAPASQPEVTEKEEKPNPVPETVKEEPEAPKTELTLEALKDILPVGTKEVRNTDDGLVLVFDDRFYHKMAMRSLEETKEKVSKKVGYEVNVISSYSESKAKTPVPEAPPAVKEEPIETPAEPEPVAQAPAEEPEQETAENAPEAEVPEDTAELTSAPISKMNDEQKNLISDILLCFDGREER